MQPTWAPPFEARVERVMGVYGCPGLSLGVAGGGEPVYWNGFGLRDRERGLPMTPDTVAGIGSCTKSVTCIAIMQLQEAGRLSVHDPVARHLPEFATPDRERTSRITLHHLMTHTAGLPRTPAIYRSLHRTAQGDPSVPPALAALSLPPIESTAQLLGFFAQYDYTLLGEPGEHFSYSDDGFAILGAVIERVSGQPYREYVAEHILRPAGLTHMAFSVDELPEVATQYAICPPLGAIQPAPQWWDAGPHTPAGFLRANVRDLLRYAEIFRTGGTVGGVRILAPESVQAMMTPYARVDEGVWYGYGLNVRPDCQGVSIVDHGGSLKGVSAHLILMPEQGLTGAVLTNLQGVPSGMLLLGALMAETGRPVEARWLAPCEPVPMPADELAACCGVYATGDGAFMEVTPAEDGLQVVATGLTVMNVKVTHVGGRRFMGRVREEDVVVRFLADGAGQVWGLWQGLRILRRVCGGP